MPKKPQRKLEDILEERKPVHDRIIELTHAGMIAADIAKELGICQRTVDRVRQKRGVRLIKPYTRLSDEERQRIEQMLDEGASGTEIARTLNRTLSTISRHYPGRMWTKKQQIEHYRIIRSRAYKDLIV